MSENEIRTPTSVELEERHSAHNDYPGTESPRRADFDAREGRPTVKLDRT